jgi:cytochrome o ubiquinol oxidase operon protein cyoD
MKHQSHPIDPTPHEGYGAFKSYLKGFVLSVIFTLLAYFLVVEQVFSGWSLLLSISGLAFIQAIVQLVFFLHLGSEPSPYWNLTSFLFMFLILVILVVGTLWIMYHLDYAMSLS